jgi:3,4-dihydroxy-2-butanone 4-phosphate synthase
MGDIYYSTDEEVFNYDCIEEAIEDFETGETVTIYQGEAARRSASSYCHFDADSLTENAVDNAGEFAEGWPGASASQEIELLKMVREAVDKWADKHKLQPAFYGVKNIKEVRVKVLSGSEYELIGESRKT